MLPTFRFAPSPNGRLHLGHARSALLGHQLARRLDGRFLVRIEDIDLARARPEYISAALDDLAWLGLTWELPVLRQSEHFDVYRAAAAKLEARGLLYRCYATRSEILSASSAGTMRTDPDGTALVTGPIHAPHSAIYAERQNNGEPYCLRLSMSRAIEALRSEPSGRLLSFTAFECDGRQQTITATPAMWGDAVIVRKDTPSSYHLAVVLDDARQGVTHVTRGKDLLAATHLHRLLQALLGLPAPAYHHHELVTDASGQKLSKSYRSPSLADLRANGATFEDVQRLAFASLDER